MRYKLDVDSLRFRVLMVENQIYCSNNFVKSSKVSGKAKVYAVLIKLDNKSNISLYLLYYAEACNELAELISASLSLWAI